MILIIGCHRSGTSILSQLVHSLLKIESKELNQHFEDKAIVSLNEWLLRRAGGSWEYVLPLLHANKSLKSIIDEVVVSCFKNNPDMAQRVRDIGVIKDPRLCATWTNYLSVFEDIKIIYIYRDPLAVAKSLHQRFRDLTPTRAFDLGSMNPVLQGAEQYRYWSVRTHSMEGARELVKEYDYAIQKNRSLHDIEFIDIQYEELLTSPEVILIKLSNFLGVQSSPEELLSLRSLMRG